MIEQLGIGFFGVIAVVLSQDSRDSRRRWACIFGLCAQPFWMYSALIADQWGVIVLSLIYAWGWMRGVRTYWWKA